MTHIYDQTTRAAVRKRMSPPNRESVAQIARDTGITEPTLLQLAPELAAAGRPGTDHREA
jgi:hypothetical protein